MARPKKNPQAPKTAEPTKAPVVAEAGILPVVALNKITYGDQKHAPAGAIFTPVSKGEYDELFALNAVRKPNDGELAVYRQMAPSTAATELTPEPDAADDADDGEGGDEAPDAENPLG